MRIIIIYNEDFDNVISKFGIQNQELYSKKTIEQIKSVFTNHGFEVQLLDGNLDMFEQLRGINRQSDRIPFVFNRSYGIQGENRYSHIPSIFEMLGLPYFGSGPFGHTLALDKIVSKIIMNNLGIPSPEYWQFYSPEDFNQNVRFPVIIKPVMEAGSIGLKVVNNKADLRKEVTKMLDELHQGIFAERFISGREFVLGLVGNGDNIECLPLLEIDMEGNPDDIQTQYEKINEPKQKHTPDDIPKETIQKLENDAKRLFRLLRLKDYARIDMRMDKKGNFYFLEINSMASLGENSSFIASARAAGYTYDEIIMKLFDVAVSKYFVENQKLKVRYETIRKKNRR